MGLRIRRGQRWIVAGVVEAEARGTTMQEASVQLDQTIRVQAERRLLVDQLRTTTRELIGTASGMLRLLPWRFACVLLQQMELRL